MLVNINILINLQVRCPDCDGGFYHGMAYGTGFTTITKTTNSIGGGYYSGTGTTRKYQLSLLTTNTWQRSTADASGTPPGTAGAVPQALHDSLLTPAKIPCCGKYTPIQGPVVVRTGLYKFGFNGQELDNEVTGVTGSHYTTFFRELDTRTLRWWGIDPEISKSPWESPYLSMGGNPVIYYDPLGNLKDWYQSEAGNVIWQEGSTESINVNGEEFTNIGKTFVTPIKDGGFLHYFQNIPIAITNTKISTGKLLAKNDNVYRHAMKIAPSSEMQSQIFLERFNITKEQAQKSVLIGTFSVPASVVIGEYLLSGGIISTSFWAGKAAISAGTQAILNKGNVDLLDVGMDAFMTYGASALFGGMVDVNVGRNINLNWVGNGKTLGQFGLDVGTGYLFGTLNSKAFNGVSPYLQNDTERAILNTVTSTPSSVLGGGVNKAIKEKLNE